MGSFKLLEHNWYGLEVVAGGIQKYQLKKYKLTLAFEFSAN